MRLFSKSNVATIAIVTGIVVASGTGGAVAGAMITGKQIKDGTVTTADIANNNLTGADLRNGSIGAADLTAGTRGQFLKIARPTQVAELSSSVGPGATASAHVTCPSGQVAISGTALWNNTFEAAGSYPSNDQKSWSSQGENPSGTSDAIYLIVTCAKVG